MEKSKKVFLVENLVSVGLLGLMIFAFAPMQVGAAAHSDGETMGIALNDTDLDGRIDEIEFSVRNMNGNTWSTVGSLPYGISVTQDGNPIEVTSVTVENTSYTYFHVTVDLNQDDMVYNTDGVTAHPVELMYTAGGADAITGGVYEVNAIASGDSHIDFDTEYDEAKPIITASRYYDNGFGSATATDGTIDSIEVDFSEDVVYSTCDSTDWGITSNGFSSFEVQCDDTHLVSGSTITLGVTVNENQTGTDIGSEPAIEVDGYRNIQDVNGNSTSTRVSVDIDDYAAPVLVSSIPSDGNERVPLSPLVTLNFSEPMDTAWTGFGTDYDFIPEGDPSAWSDSWNDDQTVILSRTGSWDLNTQYTVTLNGVTIQAQNGFVLPMGTFPTWSFYTLQKTGASSGPVSLSYGIDLLSLNGGERLNVGDVQNIEWQTNGSGVTNYVSLAYSLDVGETFEYIVEHIVNSGSYEWIVPNYYTTEAMIRVEGTDMVNAMSNDVSDDVFTIWGDAIVGGVGGDPTAGIDVKVTQEDLSTDPVVASLTNRFGLSPVTGGVESISEVNIGDYIKSKSFDTVYFIGEDLKRHPFLNESLYFTWENSFGSLKLVTDATLPEFEIGSPMLPNPDSSLVKIQSNEKTYAIESDFENPFNPILRWITSEGIAESLYGENWDEFVIDLPPTLFSHFQFGEDIIENGDFSASSSMKVRK